MIPVREQEAGIAGGGYYQVPGRSLRGPRPETRCYLQQTLSKLSSDTVRLQRRVGASPRSRDASPPQMATPSSYRGVEDSSELGAELAADGPAVTETTSHALLAVAKVISSWESEVRQTADIWSGHLSAQAKWSAEGDDRWRGLHAQLEKLESNMASIMENMQKTNMQFQEHQKKESSELQSSFKDAARDISSAVSSVIMENRGVLVRENKDASEAIKKHVTELVSGTLEGADEQQNSISQQMGTCNERLQDLTNQMDTWHVTVDELRKSADEAKDCAARTQKSLDESVAEVRRLGGATEALQQQLQETQTELERVTFAPAMDVWKKLKDIETRGTLRIDRQTGKVDLLKTVQFSAANPNAEPTATLKDPEASCQIFSDIAEVTNLFRTPLNLDVQILPGKGGKPEFWSEVANSQAQMIKEQLIKQGVAESLVTATGDLAAKGAKANFTLIQLNQDIFPAATADGPKNDDQAKKGKKK